MQEREAVRIDSDHVGYKAPLGLRLKEPLHRYSCKVIPKSKIRASIVANVVTVGPVNYFCSELLEAKAIRTDSNHIGHKAFPELKRRGTLHRYSCKLIPKSQVCVRI
jgi:hypothetical protein